METNVMMEATDSWRFEEGVYNLQDLCYKHPPPVVVQCDHEKSEVTVDNATFDLSQPILLYRQRNINKVSAKFVHKEIYRETGPHLLIPEDYKGWFVVLQKKQIKPTTLNYNILEFKLVADLSNSNTQTFLIGGTEQVHALQVTTFSDGKYQHQQRSLFPGEVLRKGKIYVGERKRKSGLFRRGKIKQDYYLFCTDEYDREILLPYTQKGLFYTLTTESGRMPYPVLQMKDILDKKYLPATVKLLYGRKPSMTCEFTDILRLEYSHFERSVIGCTTLDRNNFIELPLTCPLKFKIFEMDDVIVSSTLYKRAFAACNEKAHLYMRGMKVCHEFGTLKIMSEGEEDFQYDMPPNPHILRKRNQYETGTDDNRESGYIEMRDSLELTNDTLYTDMRTNQDIEPEINVDQMDYLLPSEIVSSKHSFFTRNRLKNTNNTLVTSRHQPCSTPPPTTPPPPLPSPCSGTLPRSCHTYLDLDSGISDGKHSTCSTRHGSVRLEQAYTDQIYDIPRIPKRHSEPNVLDMYSTNISNLPSLDTFSQTSQSAAINYENFSILREVVPKPCDKVNMHQKILMEPTQYDTPQNIDRNSAILMNRSTLSRESGSLDSKCGIAVTLLDRDTSKDINLNSHTPKDILNTHDITFTEDETGMLDDERKLQKINTDVDTKDVFSKNANKDMVVDECIADKMDTDSDNLLSVDYDHFQSQNKISLITENDKQLHDEAKVQFVLDGSNFVEATTSSEICKEKVAMMFKDDTERCPLKDDRSQSIDDQNESFEDSSPINTGHLPNEDMFYNVIQSENLSSLSSTDTCLKEESDNVASSLLPENIISETNMPTVNHNLCHQSGEVNDDTLSTNVNVSSSSLISYTDYSNTETVQTDEGQFPVVKDVSDPNIYAVPPPLCTQCNSLDNYINTRKCDLAENVNIASNIYTNVREEELLNNITCDNENVAVENDPHIANKETSCNENDLSGVHDNIRTEESSDNALMLPDTCINIITGGTTVNGEELPDKNTSIILDETSDTGIHTKLVSEETLNKAHILPDINTNSITAGTPDKSDISSDIKTNIVPVETSEDNVSIINNTKSENRNIAIAMEINIATSNSSVIHTSNRVNREICDDENETVKDDIPIDIHYKTISDNENIPPSINRSVVDNEILDDANVNYGVKRNILDNNNQEKETVANREHLDDESRNIVSEVQTNTAEIETWKCENVISSETLDNENVASDVNTNLENNEISDNQCSVNNMLFDDDNALSHVCTKTGVDDIFEDQNVNVVDINSSNNEIEDSNINDENISLKKEDDELSKMSSDEIVKGFRKLGIRKNVIDIVEQYHLKASNLKDLQRLGEIFPGISRIDKRKISMFLQGMMQATNTPSRKVYDPMEPSWV